MKSKHNKKRNTALIYEALMRELTKAVVAKNKEAKDKIVSIVKEHFAKDKLMAKELKLYQAICETYEVKPHIAEKMIFEIRKLHEKIDKKELFNEQSAIIDKINKSFGKSFFSSFISNYKTLATISQVFSDDVSIKKKIMLEERLVDRMSATPDEETKMQTIDNLTFKTFVEKFNKEYATTLFEEQRELLSRYIFSFLDNGIDLKVYLSVEIERLKKVITESLDTQEIKSDSDMITKTKKVLEMMNNFKNERVEKPVIKKVLKIQSLAREIINDVN